MTIDLNVDDDWNELRRVMRDPAAWLENLVAVRAQHARAATEPDWREPEWPGPARVPDRPES